VTLQFGSSITEVSLVCFLFYSPAEIQ